jgi:glycosyltransferase involved in cell wall biosynthesis
VIEVLPELLRQWPDLRLVLIGGGALEQALRDQAAALGVCGRVVFAGARAQVAPLLPALDVFLLPSLTEGLSIALLEAAAAALPIVATAVGGTPEIVRHGETGLLVPPADGVALRLAVQQLLSDPQESQAMGRRAREWVERNASIDALCEAYEAFYRRCGAEVWARA